MGGKCIYVWFEAVQGYSTVAHLVKDACAISPDGEDLETMVVRW